MATTGISTYELPSATDIDSASTLNLGLTGTGASSSTSGASSDSSLDSLLSSGDSSESSLDSILGDLGLGGSSSSSSSSADSSDGSTLGDLGSFLSDLGSSFTSALESPLGELALYGGLTAYGLNSASEAQQETTSEANQIISASQPYLTAGNTLLSEYQSGTLPSWAQSTVNFDTTEGQDIINSGQALQTIANQNLAQYSSGQLKPADQLALDQQTAAQTQQVMSQLGAGGTVDSSVAAAYTQQIQQNAQVTQQSILNSYYTTGDNAYNSWLTSTTEGANLINQGGQFAQTTFNQMLTGALGLSDIGMQGLTTAIGLEIQSDTALSQEVSNLMSNLASAYAYTLAGPGRSGTSSTSSTTGTVASLLGAINSGSNLLSDLTGGSLASNVASDSSAADSLVNSDLGDVSSLGDVGDSGLLSQLSSEGFSTAGGAAATAASSAAEVGDYADAADAATESALGSAAASDGTAASVAASNDAALAASDGGSAGAAAGISSDSSSLSDIGGALSLAGAAYGLYNTIENYQSGSTGTDTLNAAETGAAIGTYIVPGIGTVVGAVIGGVVGAISSAFGGGETDPETLDWDNIAGQLASNPSMANSFTAAQSYQLLAGVMDAKNNTSGHSEPIEQVFGREGEGNLMTQMTTQINSAITSGQISATATPAQIYQQVVVPWLASKNASIPANQMTSNGQPEGQALPYVLQRLIGLWQAGNLTSSTQVGISGQTISGLPSYGA